MDLTPYTGLNADHGELEASAVALENSTFSRSVYRQGSVDSVFFDHAVALQDATADYLYNGDFTKLTTAYVPGTRVFLEQLTHKIMDGLKTDREKGLALVNWIRKMASNYRNVSNDPFHGGAEEEVIRKGSDMCNEMARVMIVMAQIAGIPSRYIGHMTMLDYDDKKSGSGHGVCELYLDGAWAYYDIRGKFFEKPNGQLANTWELINDISLIENASEESQKHWDPRCKIENATSLFKPHTAHIVLNYYVEDHAKYDYSWTYPSVSGWVEGVEKARYIRTTKHNDLLQQPAFR